MLINPTVTCFEKVNAGSRAGNRAVSRVPISYPVNAGWVKLQGGEK